MKFKVTIVGEDWGFYTIEDYEEMYEDILEHEDEESAKEYFKCGEFIPEDVKNDIDHFIIAYLEALRDSARLPLDADNKKIIKYIVERVD